MELPHVHPQSLLGLHLESADGAQLGTVVDVGLTDWQHAKFLLVRGSGPGLLRVEFCDVAAVGPGGIRLAPPSQATPASVTPASRSS